MNLFVVNSWFYLLHVIAYGSLTSMASGLGAATPGGVARPKASTARQEAGAARPVEAGAARP